MSSPSESQNDQNGKDKPQSGGKQRKSKRPRKLPSGISINSQSIREALQLRPRISPPFLALESAGIEPSAAFVADHWNETALMLRQEGYSALLSMSNRLLKLIGEQEVVLEESYRDLYLAKISEEALLAAAADGHPKQAVLPFWLKDWHGAEGRGASRGLVWRSNEKAVQAIQDIRNATVAPTAEHDERVIWHTEASATGEPAAYILTVSDIDRDGTPTEPTRTVRLDASATWGEALDAATSHRQALEQELIPLNEKDEATLDLLLFRHAIVEAVTSEYEALGYVGEHQTRKLSAEDKEFVRVAMELIHKNKHRSRTPLLRAIEVELGWGEGRALAIAKDLGAYRKDDSGPGEAGGKLFKTELDHFAKTVRSLAYEIDYA